jgi:hypothetical protein
LPPAPRRAPAACDHQRQLQRRRRAQYRRRLCRQSGQRARSAQHQRRILHRRLLFGFDFAPDGHLTIYNNGAIPDGSYIASFDFGATLAAPIAGFSVTGAGATGGTPVLTVVDSHTISIDLSAVQWNGDYNPLQTAITLQAAPVPEPAAA